MAVSWQRLNGIQFCKVRSGAEINTERCANFPTTEIRYRIGVSRITTLTLTQCMEFVTETFVVQLNVIGGDTQICSLQKCFVLLKTRHGYMR